MRLHPGAIVWGLLLASGATSPVWAQAGGDRPSEQDLFGGGASPSPSPAPGKAQASPAPSVPAPPAAAPAATAPGGGTERDEAVLGTGDSKFLADYVAPENPLQIGGQLYLRAQSTAYAHRYPGAWTIGAPSLLDVYLDARPNPRVRRAPWRR